MSNQKGEANQNSKFALHLYQTLRKESDDNIFVSPYSVAVTMSMVLLGAKENTAKEIVEGLNYGDVCDTNVHEMNLETIKKVSKIRDNICLETANNLFSEISYTLKEDFMEKCHSFYQSDVKQLDFIQNTEAARVTINDWAQKATKNKIKDLLPSGSINNMTRLVLANAIYFKGDWMNKFKENQTTPRDFHVKEGQTVSVQMMSQKQKFNINYDTNLKVQVLELPYKGNEVSMLLFVPTERFGLRKLEEELTPEKVCKLTSKFSKEDVIVSLPRMKLEQQVAMVPYLKAMGIREVFDEGRANLQNFSGVPDLYISTVAHKAFIEVNEEGSEAAAATAAVAMLRCALPTIRVTCDHPFMFMIKHNPSQAILFVGRLTCP